VDAAVQLASAQEGAVSAIPTSVLFAYACPDWSENGHFHIGGLIGAFLCNRCLKTGWIERDTTTRGIKLTETGKAALEWLTAQKS
jgi:hypothetical protein